MNVAEVQTRAKCAADDVRAAFVTGARKPGAPWWSRDRVFRDLNGWRFVDSSSIEAAGGIEPPYGALQAPA